MFQHLPAMVPSNAVHPRKIWMKPSPFKVARRLASTAENILFDCRCTIYVLSCSSRNVQQADSLQEGYSQIVEEFGLSTVYSTLKFWMEKSRQSSE